METEQMTTVLLCIDTIAKAREILHDTLEKVEKYHMEDMPEKDQLAVYAVQNFGINIKKEVDSVKEWHLSGMEKAISANDENEIEAAVLQIEDILLDDSVSTVPANAHSMFDVAKAAGLTTDDDKENRNGFDMVEHAKKITGFTSF